MSDVQNLTRSDFDRRIGRIEQDARPHRRRARRRGGRPGLAAVLAFCWFWTTAALATGEAGLDLASLASPLPGPLRDLAKPALALVLAVSAAWLLVHLGRALLTARGRGTSLGMLAGAALALGVIGAPVALKAPLYATVQDRAQRLAQVTRRSVTLLEERGFGEGLLPGD